MATNNPIPNGRIVADQTEGPVEPPKPRSRKRKTTSKAPDKASLATTPTGATTPPVTKLKRTPPLAAPLIFPAADEPRVVVPVPTQTLSEQPATTAEFSLADQFVQSEILRCRRNLRLTQIGGTTLAAFTVYSLLFITNGFATALQPNEAAAIAQGMIQARVSDGIPKFQSYIKEQLPIMVARVPDYAKQQIPIYRRKIENQLEKEIDVYAKQTAPQLDQRVDAFLNDNKEAVRAMIVSGGDPQSSAALGQNMKQMFFDYLSSTSVGGETLQSKIDQTLTDLTTISLRVKRLADNKNLTDNEKKARRAVAILLRSVDDNPNLQQAAKAFQNIDTTPMTGALQWKNQDEAVFTAPGKPPVIFVRKNGALPSGPPLPAKSLVGITLPAKPLKTK